MLQNQIKSEFFKLIYHKGLLLTLVFSILFVLAMLLALNPSASMINRDFIVTQFLPKYLFSSNDFCSFFCGVLGKRVSKKVR